MKVTNPNDCSSLLFGLIEEQTIFRLLIQDPNKTNSSTPLGINLPDLSCLLIGKLLV